MAAAENLIENSPVRDYAEMLVAMLAVAIFTAPVSWMVATGFTLATGIPHDGIWIVGPAIVPAAAAPNISHRLDRHQP